jgi:transcriptional regulator with XRE-family HTH domain
MFERDTAPGTQAADASPVQTVERERALTFSEALRTLLQRQNFYVPLTGSYLLPQLYERVRQVDGVGIHINTLRAYLRGESLPSDGKVRLLADALGVPRGVLLFAAGYLTPTDLPNYPGPYTTLESIEADIREVEALPLARATQERILHDLRTTARIMRLLHAEQAQIRGTDRDEREQLIEQLIELWEAPAPPPLALNSLEEAQAHVRATAAPTPTQTNPANPAPAESVRHVSSAPKPVPVPAHRIAGSGSVSRGN